MKNINLVRIASLLTLGIVFYLGLTVLAYITVWVGSLMITVACIYGAYSAYEYLKNQVMNRFINNES